MKDIKGKGCEKRKTGIRGFITIGLITIKKYRNDTKKGDVNGSQTRNRTGDGQRKGRKQESSEREAQSKGSVSRVEKARVLKRERDAKRE